MKANKQSKIRVKNSGYKRSRFNWSHDVNTTFSWGEIQPTQCKLLIPGSKTTQQVQNLIRLAPMVAPTFGRVKYKTYNQFVALSEIFPNFDALLAQEPKATAGGTRVPNWIPYISLGKLSSYVLHGARATLYYTQGLTSADRLSNAQKGLYTTQYKPLSGSIPTEMLGRLNLLASATAFTPRANPFSQYCPDAGDVGQRLVFCPHNVTSTMDGVYNTDVAGHESFIVLANTSLNSLCAVDPSEGAEEIAKSVEACDREVSIASADYVIEFSLKDSGGVEDYYFALALECSDYGKRIRKVIQGLGYQVDFASTQAVSILPLLAQYKAYFDIFGLQLYQGWETTSAAKIIKRIEAEFTGNMENDFKVMPLLSANSFTDAEKQFGRFMILEVGNEFYTEDADFVGANIKSLSVSPVVTPSSFISVDANGIGSAKVVVPTSYDGENVNETQLEDPSFADSSWQVNGAQGVIGQIQHGQVDAELLKRMYRWVNRNTILGREIAKILRAQGYGKYVDECKSNFIGSSDTMITISDVVSQSNTFDASTDEGALLGQYGGRGLQYDATGTLVFENDEYGYWITLATIVPEAGYTQGLDPTLTALHKFALYSPDFDALGMEATAKNTIVGNRFLVGFDPQSADNSGDSFGFIPRMSKFKICQNLTNGDFNRHSMRNVYLPYTLDKVLNINDYDEAYTTYVPASGGSAASRATVINKSDTVTTLPVAGNIWRTPTKYSWMGNFDRIFYNVYDRGNSLVDVLHGLRNDAGTLVGFASYNEDNFLSHAIYDVQCYAPMKPIEESYGIDDDQDVGVTGIQDTQKA